MKKCKKLNELSADHYTLINLREFYDACHAEYDQHMIKTGHYTSQEKVLSLLINHVREPILDLACGTGFLLKLLSQRFSNIVGNDLSLAMMNHAKKNNPRIAMTNENAEILSSHQKKVKTIICCNLFFYLQDRDRAIQRWVQLLDKCGKIILIEEFPFIEPKKKELKKYSTILMSLIQPISLEETKVIMAKQGLLVNKEVKSAIDKDHHLYGIVFSQRE